MTLGSSAPTTLLKSAREIEVMARGGAILYATLQEARAAVRPGITTLELDTICESFIRSHAGAEPAFKGLYGFPGSACISVNEEIVHGIPSRKRVLHEGDIVTLDVGVKLEGMYTDSAITVPVGPIDDLTTQLLDVTQRGLAAGTALDPAHLHQPGGECGPAAAPCDRTATTGGQCLDHGGGEVRKMVSAGWMGEHFAHSRLCRGARLELAGNEINVAWEALDACSIAGGFPPCQNCGE